MRIPGVVREIATQLEALDECIAMVKAFGTGSAAGPHGRVLRDAEHILQSIGAAGAIVGGLAVIHHGYHRYTRDVDLVLPASAVSEFLRIAPVKGFRVARTDKTGWHVLIHKDTGMELHLVPEGGKPSKAAPSTIPGPKQLGVSGQGLGFPSLERLIELKVASGRLQDQADVVELVKENWNRRERIRKHLARVHSRHAAAFDRLVAQAKKEASQEPGR